MKHVKGHVLCKMRAKRAIFLMYLKRDFFGVRAQGILDLAGKVPVYQFRLGTQMIKYVYGENHIPAPSARVDIFSIGGAKDLGDPPRENEFGS